MAEASSSLTTESHALERSLWDRWRVEGEAGAREQLVALYSGWARSVARRVFVRVRARPTDWGDFSQNALMGLLQAIDAFDPVFGVPFMGYATQRVRGSVFNGMRELRSTGTPTALEAGAERVASLVDEAADPIDELIAVVGNLALGTLIQSGAEAQHEKTPYDHAEQVGLHRMLRRMLQELPERERSVLELHYLQFVPFVRIAEILEVSKGRISQLHRQGLDRMRQMLAACHLADVL